MENQTNGLAAAQALFADYKKSDEKPENNKLTKEEILEKYFTPRKDKEVFRILPALPGRKHIETAYFHPVKTNSPGGQKRWRKIYCPAHNDAKVPKIDANGQEVLDANGKPFMVPKRCPLCEKSKAILAKQDQSIVEKIKKKLELTPDEKVIKAENDRIYKEAMQWEAKKFYIARGVDKMNTGHGVKFWRYKHNFKKQGVHDKLVPALQNYVEQFKVDFADLNLGTDLIISTVESTIPGSSRTYREVSNVMTRGQEKIHQDDLVIQTWMSDKTTWRDVFKPATAPQLTPEEYLERIAKGTDPYWDDQTDPNNKQWVFPDPADAELMAKANTRDNNLGSNVDRESNIEQASDLVTQSYNNVSIENVTSQDVGTYTDDAVDVGAEFTTPATPPVQTPQQPVVQQTVVNTPPPVNTEVVTEDNGYDDLPF